jgi:hypothetical protein
VSKRRASRRLRRTTLRSGGSADPGQKPETPPGGRDQGQAKKKRGKDSSMTESYEALRDQATGEAGRDHDKRAVAVLAAISAEAAERSRSMLYEIDEALVWDHKREGGVAGDGFTFYGSQHGSGSRSTQAHALEQAKTGGAREATPGGWIPNG